MRIKLQHLLTTSFISFVIVLSLISRVQASTGVSTMDPVTISESNTTGGGPTSSFDENNISTTGGMQIDAVGVSAQYNYRDDPDSSSLDHRADQLSRSRRALLACVAHRARSQSRH